MSRRKFIFALGGAAVAWPIVVQAQAAKLPTIGFIGATTPSAQPQWTDAFVRRLRELGWIEGRTVAIEYRWGEGRSDRYAEIAAEFVRLNVDVIVASGGATLAAKQTTSMIPIVFTAASDPVGSGFVRSLARPGGNVTGSSLQATDLAGKRLQFLRAAVPGLRRLAVMFNAGYAAAVLEVREVRELAEAFAFDILSLEIRQANDIAPAFTSLKDRSDALYVVADPLVSTNRTRINELALDAHLPTMHGLREAVEAGGLLSYGPDFRALYGRAADFVDKILRGTKPGNIPVEQPTQFELVINLKTGKALGLAIPQSLLASADEVIE